ncbi:hypothetical protein EDB19DRAFT_1630126 [Suillus lakei]|nr:hypothetical protein EDB19DRAFT_1630126 [Suillus lakei]
MNSTLSLTKVSTIYPSIHYTDSHASLQPMSLTVCFPGKFPRQILERSNIPVCISVSIDEEYGTFTTPVIEVASLDLRHRGSLLHRSGDSDDVSLNFSPDMSNVGEPTISFLPLPPSFDFVNRADWETVAQRIQEWVTTEVDTESSLWTWGRDAFWLAFVAAYPSIPMGKWPMWDPRIPLEGSFIEEWLQRSNDYGADEEVPTQDDVVSDIWNEFCRHAALFYPLPLISLA